MCFDNVIFIRYTMSIIRQQIYKTKQLFMIIERCIDSYNNMIVKETNNKLQLDSIEGQCLFKNHIGHVEQLFQVMKLKVMDRSFRSNYTRAYRVLYAEGELGYIPQILDSAQQAFPYIWVNGEHFQFSPDVLEFGKLLIDSYYSLIELLKSIKSDSEGLQTLEISNCLAPKLIEFDTAWVSYEQNYIGQLIKIQQCAKLKLKQAIQQEAKLTIYQNQEKRKGKIFLCGDQYDQLRRNLCELISYLNSIANSQGKGRDDLTYDILMAAEAVLTKVTPSQSKSVRNVAEKIRHSFTSIREILRLFQINLEIVDPQLKNNPQLSSCLLQYETSWEKGKRYFLQSDKQNQLLAFSSAIQTTKEKYPKFKKMIDQSEPSIFWIIPSLIVLRSLEGEDEGLALSFLINLKQDIYTLYQTIKLQYSNWKTHMNGNKMYHCYNRIQQCLVQDNLATEDDELAKLVNQIKQLSISLERVNPLDWNDMLSVIFNEEEDDNF